MSSRRIGCRASCVDPNIELELGARAVAAAEGDDKERESDARCRCGKGVDVPNKTTPSRGVPLLLAPCVWLEVEKLVARAAVAATGVVVPDDVGANRVSAANADDSHIRASSNRCFIFSGMFMARI